MTTIQQAVDEFILSCEADNLSDATVRWYRSILAALVNDRGHQDLAETTPHDMRSYIAALRHRTARYVDAPQKPQVEGGLSRDSVASHVTGLHRFWNWSADEYSVDNPMRTIRRPKRPPRQPKSVAPNDFVRLFAATTGDDAGKRDRAMLAFLADTGTRLGGIVNLQVDRLHLEHLRAVVEEKGEKKRVVHYTNTTRQLMARWLAVRRADHQYVFTSMLTGEPLTDSGLYQVIKRLKARSGVRGRVNPHAFRHNFARQYLLNGGDLVTLARLMGHEDINMTADYYAVFTVDELAQQHERRSPMRDFVLKEDNSDAME